MNVAKFSIRTIILVLFVIQILLTALIAFTHLFDFLSRLIGTAFVYIIVFSLFNILTFYILNSFVFKHIVNMSKSVSSTQGEGDLTQRLPVDQKDEIGLFSRYFNIFMAKIHNIVFKLKNVADVGKEIGKKLESSTADIAVAMNEMNANIQSIKNNGQTLDDHVKTTQGDILDIRQSIKRIVSNIADQNRSISESFNQITEMIQSIDNIDQISESKKDLLKSLHARIINSEENMTKTIASISNIAESADMIREFIEVIKSISGQTNLLAMNAAIEAAHAGEYGRGFNIVANEIRKLSTTTAENAKNVTSNLENIIVQIKDSLDLTKNTGQSINSMTDYVQNVADSMNDIITRLKAISANKNKVSASLESSIAIARNVEESSKQIDEKSGKINDAIQNLAQISSQNTYSLNETSGAIKQATESIMYISSLGAENSDNISVIEQNISRFTIIDTSVLKSSDGRPLVQWNPIAKSIPPRPDNPAQYPEDDERHWYDMEYAGWNEAKLEMPESPADGAKDKKIICLQPVKHPYQEAHRRGMQKIADAFGIKLESFCADADPLIQARQVDQAIESKPDLIIIAPISAEFSTEWYKKIHKSGIPVVVSNMMPLDEGFKYILAWRGPDDWGQTRLLAHKFAELMNYEGGYCCIRHRPGTSVYFARTIAFVTELKKIAPKMICLDMGSPNFDEEKTYGIVSGWLQRYGRELKGVMSADDSSTAIGAVRAFDRHERNDITLVVSGHCKTGLDLMKEGKIHAMTIQSAESDGALAVEAAIDWFNGLEMIPVKYLPVQVITKKEVDLYYPPQW